MAAVTIMSADIWYTGHKTIARCRVEASSILGPTYYDTAVELDSSTLAADWTDAQLCTAVATALNVPIMDVAVATAGAP